MKILETNAVNMTRFLLCINCESFSIGMLQPISLFLWATCCKKTKCISTAINWARYLFSLKDFCINVITAVLHSVSILTFEMYISLMCSGLVKHMHSCIGVVLCIYYYWLLYISVRRIILIKTKSKAFF